MKITKVNAPKNTVPVGSLLVGACWEYTPTDLHYYASPVVGMTVDRNGHCFFLNLETGIAMNINEKTQVVPVNAFLNYTEKNA